MAFNNLPRPHRIIIVITLAVAVWRHIVNYPDFGGPLFKKSIDFNKSKICYLLPELSEHIATQSAAQSEQEYEKIPLDKLDDKIDESNVHEYLISKGDILSSILNRNSFNIGNISNQLAVVEDKKGLCNLKSGPQLSWPLTDGDDDLQRLTWEMSQREKSRTYGRVENSFQISSKLQQGNWVNRLMKGTVSGNFVASARDAGLTSSEISAVIKTMQWQIDFLKLKKGDQFSILMFQEILDGRREQSQILGVGLRSGGKNYYAIRAEDGKFYDHNGTCLEKGFLRFPTVKKFRISSNFNMCRLNPVTGRVSPHRGVDFAMPHGTPVLAVGDGEVVAARRSGAAGFYIAVRHGQIYTTRYMHLRNLLVKPGQKVKRGDRIAFSGNTGRSTGPHLHYEVWINQQAVNPITARLPRTEKLTGKTRSNYLEQVKEIIQQLRLD